MCLDNGILVVTARTLRFVGGGDTLPSSVARRLSGAGMLLACLMWTTSEWDNDTDREILRNSGRRCACKRHSMRFSPSQGCCANESKMEVAMLIVTFTTSRGSISPERVIDCESLRYMRSAQHLQYFVYVMLCCQSRHARG